MEMLFQNQWPGAATRPGPLLSPSCCCYWTLDRDTASPSQSQEGCSHTCFGTKKCEAQICQKIVTRSRPTNEWGVNFISQSPDYERLHGRSAGKFESTAFPHRQSRFNFAFIIL